MMNYVCVSPAPLRAAKMALARAPTMHGPGGSRFFSRTNCCPRHAPTELATRNHTSGDERTGGLVCGVRIPDYATRWQVFFFSTTVYDVLYDLKIFKPNFNSGFQYILQGERLHPRVSQSQLQPVDDAWGWSELCAPRRLRCRQTVTLRNSAAFWAGRHEICVL